MTRFALPDNAAASERVVCPYVLLGEFDFQSGFVRVNSAVRQYTHLGNVFEPLGKMASIGTIKESGSLASDKLDFGLSGVDNSLIATTLNPIDYHGRDVRVWVGYLDENQDLIATPQIIWEGFMDVMVIRTDENSSVINLTAENRLVRWGRSSGWMYTHEHQRVFDPLDDFFNQVALIQNKELKWGGRHVSVRDRDNPSMRPPLPED